MNEQGFIVIHRKILEWKYAQFPAAVTIWVHLLAMANWKTGYFLGKEIPRGSLATSVGALAKRTGLSESTIRRWLKKFENEGQIVRRVTNRCTIISITNYAAFQDLPDDGVNNQMTGQMTGQMTDQVTGQMTPNRTKEQRNKETKEQIKDSLGAVSAPDLMEVVEYVRSENLGVNPEKFFRYYTERGWMTNGHPVRDWKKLLRSWAQNERKEAEGIKMPMPQYGQPPKKKIDLTTMPGWKEEEE